MNYPTSNNVKPNSDFHYGYYHSDQPEDNYLLDRYDPNPELRPFGSNEARLRDGLTMVEDPLSERSRSRESSPVSNKDLLELIQELKRHNEELRQTNNVLSQKLEQTMVMMKEGFRNIQAALNNIPGQMSQSLNDIVSRNSSGEMDNKAYVTDSESASIISNISESTLNDNFVICYDEVIKDHHKAEVEETIDELSRNIRDRFGFEYDSKLDLDMWLRK